MNPTCLPPITLISSVASKRFHPDLFNQLIHLIPGAVVN